MLPFWFIAVLVFIAALIIAVLVYCRFVLKPRVKMSMLLRTRLLKAGQSALLQKSKMSTQPRVTKVMENMTLHAIGSEGTELKSKPVVLFLSWMGSTTKAEDVFRSFYHSRGYDTLTYTTNPKYFLWPKIAIKPSAQLLDFMDQKTFCPIIVHSFSIGAYLYAVALYQLLGDATKWQSFRRRVKGQICDSLTVGTVENMAEGVARFSTANSIARTAIIQSLLAYFKLTKTHTTDMFNKVIDAFYNNPIADMPYLAFFSTIDPMCDYKTMMKLVDYWENDRGIEVQYKCWDDTGHCRHHRGHKDEYELMVDQYLSDIGLLTTKSKL